MNELTKLEDTIKMMLSNDHYERLLAEYYQTKIRYKKLAKMLDDYEHDNLDFIPNTPIQVLKNQLHIMHEYLWILNKRLHIEGKL